MVALIFIRVYLNVSILTQRRNGAKKSRKEGSNSSCAVFLCAVEPLREKFYGCSGVSTTTLFARSVVDVARCRSASALL